MKVQRVVGPLTIATHIIIEEVDQLATRDADMWFWKAIDDAAKLIGIPPFCPCMERPHRVRCPLGFDNYFRKKEKEADRAPA